MLEELLPFLQSELNRLDQFNIFGKMWQIIRATWPIWVTYISLRVFFSTWFSYKRREWIKSQGAVLLEIRIPKDIERSPAAMEMVLEGIWEPVVGTLTDVYLAGRVRDWFSLEIVSIGGEVKFYIWAFPKWKSVIESRIYTQFPGAEVFEVKDYALDVVYDPSKMNIFGVTTKLNKADAYPIKTYIDYELDKTNKEQEQIVDPILPLLEYMGSLKPGEQAWVQIMIQAHRKEGFEDARIVPKPDWKGGVKDTIKNIIEKESFVKAGEDKPQTLQHLTKSQGDLITSIERNAGKLAYDTMMRIVYTAPLEVFDKTRGGGLVTSTRQFSSGNSNGIRPDSFYPGISYPWQDIFDLKKRSRQRMLLEAYKRRSFFNVPFKHYGGSPYVLTVEELATLFHFPGAAATTPTLARVPSKKAEAPANLPV